VTYEYYIYYYGWPRTFVSNFGPAATVAATTGFRKGAKLHSGKVERQEEVALLVLSVGQVRGAESYYKV